MDIQKALEIIRQVASVYKGTIEEHNMIQLAIVTLETASMPKTDTEVDEAIDPEVISEGTAST